MTKLIYDRITKKMSSSNQPPPPPPPPLPSSLSPPDSPPPPPPPPPTVKLFDFKEDNVKLKVYIDIDSFPDFEEESFRKHKLHSRIYGFFKRDISYFKELEEYVVPGVSNTIAEVLSLENPSKKILIFYNNVEGAICISLLDRRCIGTFDFVIHNVQHKKNITFDFVPFLPFFQKRLETKSPMEDVDGGGRGRRRTCKYRK